VPALICGSIAYDTIMVFPDRFKNHILPDQIHVLNVSFLVPDMRREFGGCAGNIAYNLKLLGDEPLIMATVGEDSVPYAQHLEREGLARTHLREVPNTYTAQAFITTDLDDNQITAFHPGAMNHSHLNHVSEATDATFGIVAPDGREGIIQHAREFQAAGIPFIFDPGQGLPMFSGADLLELIREASYVTLNDYEARVVSERTGQSMEQLAEQVNGLVVTLGGNGSHIYADGKRLEIPCVKADALVDPTGCGDAYRAGLIYGLSRNWDWLRTGRLASLMGAIKIASRGGQNHRPTRAMLAERFHDAFGENLW
jgi:adenosine kinase